MTKIKITGFGGQGIILAGELLAYAAVIEGKEGSAIGSYGSAARGGLTCSEVVINDKFIDAPFAEKPDILMALSQEGYNKYFDSVKPEGIIIADSSMIVTKPFPRQYNIRVTDIATIELKSPLVANMIMLGTFSALTEIVSKNSLLTAVKQTVSENFMEINLKGIETGYHKGIELKNSKGV
ncbi:MAG: 2-oxoacid:acceptor oxidoreductase family protein [candidate division WOR-3 bacterium]|nr:2-oxoacid:acceptor oxidoreductase family protein [candidate division WOR-3 bacterium]